MFWRVLAVIGALTFFVNGADVLGDSDCESVTWGGSGGRARTVTMTCWDAPPAQVDGAWSRTSAGLASIGAGFGLIGLAAWPLIAAFFRDADIGGFDYPVITRPRPDPPTARSASQAPRASTSAARVTDRLTVGEAGSSRAPAEREATLADPFALLDEEKARALPLFALPVEEILDRAKQVSLSELSPDATAAVVSTSRSWYEAWVDTLETGPSGDGGADAPYRGLFADGCRVGLVAGALAVGADIERPRQVIPEDVERELIGVGVELASIATRVDTTRLIDRVPVLADLVDTRQHIMTLWIGRRTQLSKREAGLLLLASRGAIADGFFLGAMS